MYRSSAGKCLSWGTMSDMKKCLRSGFKTSSSILQPLTKVGVDVPFLRGVYGEVWIVSGGA
ncbi:hypothetical protein IMCC26256_11578 [Actinobacteria bacterium IMCC26256]|nr:hypothetical protein IMCC26256_11578 [Actinobacteria bacterium IMCC26256]